MNTKYRIRSFMTSNGIEKWKIEFKREDSTIWITLLKSFTEDMVFDDMQTAKEYATILSDKQKYVPKIIYID